MQLSFRNILVLVLVVMRMRMGVRVRVLRVWVGVLGVRRGVVRAVSCTTPSTVSTLSPPTSRMENTRRIR